MTTKEMLENYIAVDPAIQQGKPCLKGTRLPVYVILEALATGSDIEEIRREYGPVTNDQIQACLHYAALLATDEEMVQRSF